MHSHVMFGYRNSILSLSLLAFLSMGIGRGLGIFHSHVTFGYNVRMERSSVCGSILRFGFGVQFLIVFDC